MRPILIDTSVIINFTRGKDEIFERILEFSLSENVDLYIPTVVLVEVFVGSEMKDQKRLTTTKKLLKGMKRINLNEETAMLAAKLARGSNLPFDIGDFIIAASAISVKAELATNNTKHFKLIPRLKILDFKKLSLEAQETIKN